MTVKQDIPKTDKKDEKVDFSVSLQIAQFRLQCGSVWLQNATQVDRANFEVGAERLYKFAMGISPNGSPEAKK